MLITVTFTDADQLNLVISPAVLLYVNLTFATLQKIRDKKYVRNITLFQYILFAVKMYQNQPYMPQT